MALQRGTLCETCAFMSTLDAEQRAKWEATLTHGNGVRSSDIARELAKAGIRIKQHSIARHRRGDCNGSY